MLKGKMFIVVMLVMSCFMSTTAYASTSETTVNGYISPTVINVSAPAKVVFSIDPNVEKSKQFISPLIVIENHSNAPVKVKIEKGVNNFTQTANSSWKPMDVLPGEYRWDLLGTRESESYLALGIEAVQEGWRRLDREEPMYVREQNVSLDSIVFGELGGNSTVQMELVCHYGLSFREKKQCDYKIIWSFSLAD